MFFLWHRQQEIIGHVRINSSLLVYYYRGGQTGYGNYQLDLYIKRYAQMMFEKEYSFENLWKYLRKITGRRKI